MITWTVVFRKSPFAAAFRQTGFVGTWEAATVEARRMWDEDNLPADAQVYYVPSDATTVGVEVSNGKGGTMMREVKIAPTAEQKAKAARRADAIRHMLATNTERRARHGWSALEGFSGRLGSQGIEHGDLFATAAYAVDHGMTYSDVSMTQA